MYDEHVIMMEDNIDTMIFLSKILRWSDFEKLQYRPLRVCFLWGGNGFLMITQSLFIFLIIFVHSTSRIEYLRMSLDISI